MKIQTALCLNMALALCSLATHAATTASRCVESRLEVQTPAAQLTDSLKSTELAENYFNEQQPFSVEITRKACDVANAQGTFSETLLSDSARQGDIRTITQEQKAWVSEWQQKFTGGAWVTMRFTRWRKQDI